MKRLIKDLNKLSERCVEINVVEKNDIVKEMKNTLDEYLKKHEDVVAVAANQFGYTYRMFAMRFNDGIRYYVNPMITKSNGLTVTVEADPSIPERTFLIARNEEISMSYQTIFGTYEEANVKGIVATTMQREVQMLDGANLSDLGFEVFEDFLTASEEDQNAVIDMYLESVKRNKEAIDQEIENDPETKKIKDAIDFITKAANGEVKLELPEPAPMKLNHKQRRWLKKNHLLDKVKTTIKHLPFKNESRN